MQIDISLAWDRDKDIDTRICSNAKQGLDKMTTQVSMRSLEKLR